VKKSGKFLSQSVNTESDLGSKDEAVEVGLVVAGQAVVAAQVRLVKVGAALKDEIDGRALVAWRLDLVNLLHRDRVGAHRARVGPAASVVLAHHRRRGLSLCALILVCLHFSFI